MYLRSPLFTMFRILRTAEVLVKPKCRALSGNVANVPKVKVTNQDQCNMRISFKYGAIFNSMCVSKNEEIKEVLSRIKQMVSIHRQRQELVRRNYGSAGVLAFEDEDLEVSLIHNDDQHLESSNISCVDAWTQASFLKIGSHVYEVDLNSPVVYMLSLPNVILAGCAVRPHFRVEHCDVHESSIIWYHSVSEGEAEVLNKSDKSKDTIKLNEQWWVKVHEGPLYWTSQNDAGRRLRVMFIPRCGEREGKALAAESDVVISGPKSFPFEERHLYTKQLTSSDSIRCLSYNILANVYVEAKKFPYCSEVARDVYYRRQLLLKELLGYNCDILCLQEVQGRMFEFDLLLFLRMSGFDGYFMKKGGRRNEGVACFYRTSKFKVISEESVLLNEIIKKKDIFNELLAKVSGNYKDLSKLLAQDSALQIILLEHADNSKRRVLVANTHLYSNKDMPEVRLLQSAICVVYLDHIMKTQDGDHSTALLFCGDFNSLPGSSVLEFLLKGSFECCPSWKNVSFGSTDTILRHGLTLDSACGFPAYTNYTELFNGCLDYIFYDKNTLSVSEVVPMPSHESVIQQVGLPSELFPSDHIPIICTLKWK